jgi:ferrous iron transport protein B
LRGVREEGLSHVPMEEKTRHPILRMNRIRRSMHVHAPVAAAARAPHGNGHGAARPSSKRIVVVGLPNSGKTQLSNSLTGAYGLVSNYPLTTIEIATHPRRFQGQSWKVTDTPGLHGLYIQSEEELVVRSLLYAEPPDVLVQCVDANRLKESLLLTADLLNLAIPMVVVLTAVGESAEKGARLDAERLAQLLGVPVLQSPAPGKGIAELRRTLHAPISAPRAPRPGAVLEGAIAEASAVLPEGCRFPRQSAQLLLEADPSFLAYLGATFGEEARRHTEKEAGRISAAHAGAVSALVSAQRNQWVDAITAAVYRGAHAARPGFSQTFARFCRHPLYGLPILAFFLGLIYVLVVYVAGALSLLLTTAITDPVVRALSQLMPAGFWQDMLIGPHGLLTLGLFNSLTTVLPILSVFFLVFGLLEDVGYLPNLAILTRRISAKVGITGNAVIPLVLGFGCKTMATMSTRTLASRREKIIVITLIAFAIPCSAQTGLTIAILGQHGVKYFVAAFVALGLAELGAGLLLNRLMPEERHSQFIQELPPIRIPRVGAVSKKTGYRLLWFLKEAIPIFVVAALAMFVIDKLGLLALLKQALKPFMTGWLGLPVDMVDALLLTFARSEAAAGYVLKMSHAGVLNGVQSVVAVVLLTMFAQCFANIAAMFKEVRAKAAIIIVASIYVLSFLYTGAVHEILSLVSGVLRL